METPYNYRTSLVVALLLGLVAISAQAEDIKFVVSGDYGQGAKDHGVDTLVKKWNPDFVSTVGDNAYSKDEDANHKLQNAFEVDVVPVFGNLIKEGRFFPSLGNHDLHSDWCRRQSSTRARPAFGF